MLFWYFNNEIVCLTKGTFKGTVEADSWGNICHYPISLHECMFLCLTYLYVFSALTNMTFTGVFQNENSNCMYFTLLQLVFCAFQYHEHLNKFWVLNLFSHSFWRVGESQDSFGFHYILCQKTSWQVPSSLLGFFLLPPNLEVL